MTRQVTLIGLGRIGLRNDESSGVDASVLTHAKALRLSADFDVEAAVDPSPEARASCATTYGIPTFGALDDLPPDAARDVVVVASPTDTHLATVEALMRRSPPRAILMEKPMGRNVSEARAINALCEANGTRLFVDYHRAVLPSTAVIADRIRSGEIRRPYLGFAVVSGGLLTNGSHMVDLLLEWLGPPTGDANGPAGGDLWIDFAECRVLISEARPGTFSIFEVTLLAENGRLRFDGWNDRWWWEGTTADPLTAGYVCLADPVLDVPEGVDTFMAQVYENLAQALAGRPSSLRGGDRAIAVHEVLDGWV